MLEKGQYQRLVINQELHTLYCRLTVNYDLNKVKLCNDKNRMHLYLY